VADGLSLLGRIRFLEEIAQTLYRILLIVTVIAISISYEGAGLRFTPYFLLWSAIFLLVDSTQFFFFELEIAFHVA
jgi:hypothetical protein